VANAIADGTDCLMLSEETAMGKYPEQAVGVMARIAAITEPHCDPLDAQTAIDSARGLHETSAERRIALSIYLSTEAIAPVAVITPTYDGRTPRQISRFRLPMWIVALSTNEQTCQQLKFSWGVYPVLVSKLPSDWTGFAREWLYQHGIKEGLALLTYGSIVDQADRTNQILFIDLEEGL
jgi:pyruvate kinase